MIKFSSESAPEWVRNCLWWTSRFDIVPQHWHFQLSRRRICWRRLSYDKGSSRKLGVLDESFSRCVLTQVFEENLLLFAGQELEEPRH